MEAENFKGQGSISNDDILRIASDFVEANKKLPKDRILFFEYGMREFRDKFFEPLMHQRDLFNKIVCDNITKSKDEIIRRCNDDYYKWRKREEELLTEIKKLKQLTASGKS
jgi:hypothetical protein